MKIRSHVILGVLSVIASSPAIPVLAQTVLTREQCDYMCRANDNQCNSPTLLGVASACINIPYESCLPRCLNPNDPLAGNFNALALTLWGRK